MDNIKCICCNSSLPTSNFTKKPLNSTGYSTICKDCFNIKHSTYRESLVEKSCSKCKQVKSVDCFIKDTSIKSGLSYSCKDCENIVVYDLAEKVCSVCKEVKDISCFYVNKKQKTGYTPQCKDCHNKKSKIYIYNNKEICAERARLSSKKYKENNPEKRRESANAWAKRNSKTDRTRENTRKWVKENKDKLADQRKQPHRIESRKKYNEKYDELNPGRKYEYKKKRLLIDPQFKLKENLRGRIYKAIRCKGAIKSTKTLELIGCTMEHLKQHLEEFFLPTMTWDNYGTEWHIDHIKCVSSFDLTDPAQQKLCFHYTNLQPLFATTRVIDGVEYLGNLNKGANEVDYISRPTPTLPTTL